MVILVFDFDFDVPTFFGEASEELRSWAIKREDRRAAFARRSKRLFEPPSQACRFDSSMASQIGGAGCSQKPSIHPLLPPAL
jgi:hypothetical protein